MPRPAARFAGGSTYESERTGKLLYAWIGHADLRGPVAADAQGVGPVARTLAAEHFDAAVLISNYQGERGDEARRYVEWLRARAGVHVLFFEKPLSSPTDYGGVFQAAREVVAELGVSAGSAYQISAGTPAMQAVWIFLAHSDFPARLIQSSPEEGVQEVHLPFDVAARYIPISRLTDAAAARPAPGAAFSSILCRDPAMQELLRTGARFAPHPVPVLIEGPTGTGKELLARAIHAASPRASQAFVAVNCGGLPETLLESELFGHERGAFTGAVGLRRGLFERANRGTLFLDEVGEMSAGTQTKLLRVLEQGRFTRVGGEREIGSDVRIIAATNRNLAQEVARAAFREDLLYRLLVVYLRIPALSERPDDLPLLVDHFLARTNRELLGDNEARAFTPAARKELLGHSWPGNVRELENTITRCALLTETRWIDIDTVRRAIISVDRADKPALERALGGGFSIDGLIADLQRNYVRRALAAAAGNKEKAARLLGLNSGTTLANRMRKLGVTEDGFKGS